MKDDIKKTIDNVITDKEALEILRKTTITLGRKNNKLRIYLALYKAYYALEEKVEKDGGLNNDSD